MGITGKIKNLKYVFEPKSVAIIGASRDPGKIGHIIMRNFFESSFRGKVYPVNPNATEVLNIPCHPSVLDIKGCVDCAIIAIPAAQVNHALVECGRKGVKAAVVITGGFGETGNVKLEQKLKQICGKYKIALVGPNCMGVINAQSRVDSVFLPIYKLGRPHSGGISFVSQSGAVGGCIVDLVAKDGIGMAKFVSYGNGTVVDESDYLEYLYHDRATRVVVLYVEGVKTSGAKFLSAMKKLVRKKPLIVLKAGKSSFGAKAAMSHTGSIAGEYTAYEAAIRQAHAIEAHSLEDLFNYSKMFTQPFCTGKNIGILTNGGGNGVLGADAVSEFGLSLAAFGEETRNVLSHLLPPYATMSNPLDVIGDADSVRYGKALETMLADENVDAVMAIILFQTVQMDSRVVNVIVRASQATAGEIFVNRRKASRRSQATGCKLSPKGIQSSSRSLRELSQATGLRDFRESENRSRNSAIQSQEGRKPIFAVVTGGEYAQLHRRILESYGVPTYDSPYACVKSLNEFIKYSKFRAEKGK
ncbi:CoA-binding protein [Candidatus Micrarchaeota archaeon CG06_land_8_20_14_3_00_50_6]|nr:MAG: CoA-binding protein [Candidatus Micrarchaeota archaeon CG06_land_8_20_14_3_00_50_6]